jgi:hypothetical protein
MPTATCPSDRRVVVLLSTMRAGSTLLKALLAEADDVSNLPEINFQRFQSHSRSWQQIARLHRNPIIVLKRPAWYHEVLSYPRLPAVESVRAIILVRDVYETIVSLRQMTFGKLATLMAPLVNSYLVQYWARVTERLGNLDDELGDNASVVRYEDLVMDPIETTRALFAFIGSRRAAGVESYREPKTFQWQWGQDDGGPKIRSLRVQPPKAHDYEDRALLEVILRSQRVQRVRAHLAYPALPHASTRGV